MSEPWFVKDAQGSISGPLIERDVSDKLLNGEIDDQQFVRQGASGPWCEAARARVIFQQLAEVGWYIRTDATVFGPFTDTKLLQLHRDGEIASGSEIRQGTKSEWKSADAVLAIFQNQRVTSSAKSEPINIGDPADSMGGGKWSIEPMRHAVVDLEVHFSSAAKECEYLEHLLLQEVDDDSQMGERLLVKRTNGEPIGYLGIENSQQILGNADRGLTHVTLLHSQPAVTPISVAIILCPAGCTSEDCQRYIADNFQDQLLRSDN